MDGSKGRGPKIFSRDRGDLWIEALVAGEEGLPPADAISFQPGSIDHIRAIGSGHSLIRLASGAEILFDIPQAKLIERIQTAEDDTLDLKAHAVLEPKAMLLQRLRGEFRREAEAQKYAAFNSLAFRAFIRPANKADFHEIEFRGTDISWDAISEGDSILGGKNIRLRMKDGRALPFAGDEFIMEGKLAEFTLMCQQAQARGQAALDLRGYSMQKGATPPPDESEKPRPRRSAQP